MNYGIVVVIVLLVPILFQVVMQSIATAKRHDEVLQRLAELERKLDAK